MMEPHICLFGIALSWLTIGEISRLSRIYESQSTVLLHVMPYSLIETYRRFGVITAVAMKNTAFWHVRPP